MASKKNGPRQKPPASSAPLIGLLLGGIGFAILAVSLGIFFVTRQRREEELPPVHLVENPPLPPAPPVPVPDPFPQPIPKQQSDGAWWDSLNDATLKTTVAQLGSSLPQDKSLFEDLGNKSDLRRWKAYKTLTEKLPELLRNPSAKRLLAQLLIESYAQDPSDQNLEPLRDWFVWQIPQEGKEYPRNFKISDMEASFWAVDVSLEVLARKAIRLERGKTLSESLGAALGFDLDPSMPSADLKSQAEKMLALRFYRNLVPTAAKAYDNALAFRGILRLKVTPLLSPSTCEKVDLELAKLGFPNAKTSWPIYSNLLVDCVKSEDAQIGLGVVRLYEQADAELAAKVEPLLAPKWKVVEDSKLNQAEKVKALLRALGAPDPTDRLTILEKLSRDAIAGMKAPAQQGLPILQETSRLSHASTMACALWKKEAGLGRFDELVANVPPVDVPEEKKSTDPKDKVAGKTTEEPKSPAGGEPMPIEGKGVVVVGPKVFNDQLLPGAFSKIHPVVLRRGRTYMINMHSGFDNYLYLQNSRGQQLAQDDDSGGSLNAQIIFFAPVDDTYRIIATSFGGRRVGAYRVSVQETGGMAGPGFGSPFPPIRPPAFFGKRPFMPPFAGPGMFPGQGMPNVKVVPGKNPGGEDKVKKTPAADALVDDADLKNLAGNAQSYRVTALKNISSKVAEVNLVEKDFSPRQASAIANYLATGINAKTEEVNEVLTVLGPLSKSRNLMLALADSVDGTTVKQTICESVIGTLLDQPLKFGKTDDWRNGCRRLLLQHALDLTGNTKNTVTDTADLIRDYYREQAVLLGIAATELTPMTRPSQVLESLINHFAANLGKKSLSKADQEQLERIPRQLLAAQFAAQDDLEYTATLQRIWIHVLAMHLEQQHPERGMQMRQLITELSESDTLAVNALEQLRGGEEKILRLWGLALDIK